MSALFVLLKFYLNERMLSGCWDKAIKIWNINTGDCLKTLKGLTNTVSYLKALSEEKIISVSWDQTIKIRCLKTNSCIQTINAH
jgi:F-box/WD-40 domain protein MET30